MNADGFATLHGGMLMRKGRAEPSAPSTLSMPHKSDSPSPTAPGFAADRREPDISTPDRSARLKLGSCVESADAPASADGGGLLTQKEKRALRFAAAMLDTSEEALINAAVRAHLERLAATTLRQCPCFLKRLERPDNAD